MVKATPPSPVLKPDAAEGEKTEGDAGLVEGRDGGRCGRSGGGGGVGGKAADNGCRLGGKAGKRSGRGVAGERGVGRKVTAHSLVATGRRGAWRKGRG